MGAKLLNIEAGGRQRLERYELIGEIASGGMATVYLARLTGVGGFQRFVAIKRLHPHLQGEKEFVEMFLDEARLAAGIHHPNVVPILEVGSSDSGYFLVMEYVEGETLARLLARSASRGARLPTPIALRIGIDMLNGLHAAHELRDETGGLAGLVHRDVSPQNVLVGADGVTRITDFGVARAASRLTATRVGQLKGKIAYMAPEQASGAEDIDRRADVFASGIVLWEALAHKRLFKAENEAATLARVMSEPIPPLTQPCAHLPAAISDVVDRALARDLSARFATCADFADALEQAGHQSGNVATGRDLQAFLADLLGEEIQAQREAVRAWIARSESSSLPELKQPPSSSVSAASMSLPNADLSGSTSSPSSLSRTALAMALLGLAALGALCFIGFQRFFRPAAAVSAATPEPTVIEVPVPQAVSAAPAPTAAASAEASARGDDAPPAAPPPAEVVEALEQPSSPRPSPAPSKPRASKPASQATSSKASSSKATSAPTPAAPAPEPKVEKKPDPLDVLNQNPYR